MGTCGHDDRLRERRATDTYAHATRARAIAKGLCSGVRLLVCRCVLLLLLLHVRLLYIRLLLGVPRVMLLCGIPVACSLTIRRALL